MPTQFYFRTVHYLANLTWASRHHSLDQDICSGLSEIRILSLEIEDPIRQIQVTSVCVTRSPVPDPVSDEMVEEPGSVDQCEIKTFHFFLF